MTAILLGMLGAAFLFVSPSVQAQTISFLDMTISPGMQTAAPGDSPLWDVQLINNNPDPSFFILVGFNDGLGTVPDISVPNYNPTPFGQQVTLAPNGSVIFHNLYQTTISPLAGIAAYDSTAETTYDLYTSNAFNDVLLSGVTASGDWTLNVQQPTASGVPEPGSVALFVSVMVTGGIFFLRCRRKR